MVFEHLTEAAVAARPEVGLCPLSGERVNARLDLLALPESASAIRRQLLDRLNGRRFVPVKQHVLVTHLVSSASR